MNRRRMIACAGAAALALTTSPSRAQEPATPAAVVLMTLDGARHEEIFGGLDLDILKSTLKKDQRAEDTATYKRYWAATPDERRRKLMPFFWRLVTEEGSIAGNPALRGDARLTNRASSRTPAMPKFSSAGRSTRPSRERSDPQSGGDDPQGLRRALRLSRKQVATFASWDVFNAIAEHTEGATVINAGDELLDIPGTVTALTNRLQREAGSPWDHTRLDAFTVNQAMAYLAHARPRVLYLALDETDDWAHDGRYDRLLDAYARSDRLLERLWTWLQAQPDYRGRTHLLITTDHGRGHDADGWRHHGEKYPDAERVWMAFVSPKMAQRGEWRGEPAVKTNQIAATLASWVGVDWNADHPAAGKPIR